MADTMEDTSTSRRRLTRSNNESPQFRSKWKISHKMLPQICKPLEIPWQAKEVVQTLESFRSQMEARAPRKALTLLAGSWAQTRTRRLMTWKMLILLELAERYSSIVSNKVQQIFSEKKAVHEAPNPRTWDRIPKNRVRDPRAAPRDQPATQSDRSSGQNMVPKSTHERKKATSAWTLSKNARSSSDGCGRTNGERC